MIDDLFQAGTDAIGRDMVRRPPAPTPKPNPSWYSGLGAAPGQAFQVGGARAVAFGAEVAGAFGSVLGAYPEATGLPLTDEQKKQAAQARERLLKGGPEVSNEAGDIFRRFAADSMPDPQTTGTAAQMAVGLGSFMVEIGGAALTSGPLAPLTVGGMTGFDTSDELRQKGVDLATRTKAGAATAAANTLGTAVPMTAATRLGAAAKGVAIGEGTIVGQTAAVRTILRHGGYDKIAEHYDPFDPVMLAVGLVPGVMGAALHGGPRAAPAPKLSDVVLGLESGGRRYGADGQILTSPKGAQGEMQVMPGTSRDPGFGVVPAKDGSADELARVGRDYLDAMQARYQDPAKAMAAYNAGPGALDAALAKYGDAWLAHMPAETQAYVAKGTSRLGAEQAVAAKVKENPELVEAARVTQVADAIEANRLTPDGDIPGRNAHADAMDAAVRQIAAGEDVNVAGIVSAEAHARASAEITARLTREQDIVNPVDLLAPPAEKVRQLEALTKENRSVVASFMERLDRELGTESKDNVKLSDRILEKAARPSIRQEKPWHDVEHIRDSYRFKTVLDNIEQLPQAIERLQALGAQIVKPDVAKVLKPKAFGWRIAAFDLRMPNGQLVEYYLPLRELEAAKKDKGHELFEQVRNLDPKDPAAAAKTLEVAAESRALYQAAFDAYLKRTGQDETAIAASLERAAAAAGSSRSQSAKSPTLESGAGERQAPSGERIAENLPGPNTAAALESATNARTADISTTSGSILPQAALGKPAVAITERGAEVPVRWAVVDVSELVTSHDNSLAANPAYPAELQPRDRSRAASEEQIARIENGIRPELLGDSPKASDGAPIIGQDGAVESGNARTIALRRAYESGKADRYRDFVLENAERFGIDRQAAAGKPNPVLVRIRDETTGRAEFARQANESTVAAMSQTEQAKADAARMPDLEGLSANEDGSISIAQSGGFIRSFMQHVASPTERGALMTAAGDLSQQGVQRIRNAVFAKAYGDADLVSMLAESTDGNVKNILTGMLRAAPEVAKLQELMAAGARPQADVVGPLVEAVRKFSQLRRDGMTVDHFLAQGSMFGDGPSPELGAMLRALEADARSPKRIAETIGRMTDAVDSMGDPRQAGMFDETPSAKEALKAAIDGGLNVTEPQVAAFDRNLSLLERDMPDMIVPTEGGGTTTLKQAMEEIRRTFDEDSANAQLAEVATDCFLRAA